MSPSCDRADHSILIDRLDNLAGLSGTALNWFMSYLKYTRSCQLVTVYLNWLL